MRLKDKTAVVTGAAGAIGGAISERFAEEGAKVVLTDINEEGGNKIVERIKSKGGEATFIRADAFIENELIDMINKSIETYGQIDILVNNVGYDFDIMKGLDEICAENWNKCINLNLVSFFICTREAAKGMMERRYGKIINMSSISRRGNAIQLIYSATKAGIEGFTRSCAAYLGPYNVNVNAIAPALIETESIKSQISKEEWEALKADCEFRYPLGRVGQPIDVANCALFLASDESSFITGQTIEVSGGARL
ncbi:MAG: SDR family oxidoreductase [Candidatus Schekmanbacteria bacterium]|nr:MAG: SDR family oxidoreductase [Candidatus Schekmanbacteria bacterium]